MTAFAPGVDETLSAVTRAVAERAQELDENSTDVRVDIRELGAAGLFAHGLDGDLPTMVRVIATVASESLTVGFSVWAHRIALHYLQIGAEAPQSRYAAALLAGARPGVTAMAAGLKHVAGLGPLPLMAERDGDSLIISGPIHWASNVFDDAVIVLPAAIRGGDAEDSVIVALDVDTPGIVRHPAPSLMALNATASTSLRLNQVRVPADAIVSTDLPGFVRRIRPAFLLLQTAFCVGVSRASLAAASTITGVLADPFGPEIACLSARLADAEFRLRQLADDPSNTAVAQHIRLRLDASGLAADATRAELALTGGAAYTVRNAANRRFREAAFLPIQSPSEGQLRWELAQSR